jgi:hypothetical protein
VSVGVFYVAGQTHNERTNDKTWMIDWRSWLCYAAFSVIICVTVNLNPFIGVVIGPLAGFAGTFFWFLITFREGFADIK